MPESNEIERFNYAPKGEGSQPNPNGQYQPYIPAAAPGWYPEPGTPGVMRYWNGMAWEEWRRPLVAAPGSTMAVSSPVKDTAVAYVLAFFLGALGIHNFYLGRTGPAVGQLVLTLLGIFTFGATTLAAEIWVIVDLFLIPGWVRAINARAGGTLELTTY